MTDEISEELIQQMRKHEKLVIRIAEILTLKRPVVLGIIVLFVWGLFAFAYSVEAGFFASICLIISAIYVISILYSLFGDKIESIFFKELSDRTGVPTVEECAHYVQKFMGDGSIVDKIVETSNSQLLIVGGVCFGIAIFFKYFPPFWFNLLLATAAILAVPIYTVINQKNAAPSSQPKQTVQQQSNVEDEQQQQGEEGKVE